MEAINNLPSISDAPVGALIGGVFGYIVATKFGRDKTFAVISFVSVGVIIGTAIGARYKL